MPTYGLTLTGFEPKPLDAIKLGFETAQRATIDTQLNQTVDSLFGQINGILASAAAECWEEMQKLYRAQDPDAAEGEALDAIMAITGTVRGVESKSYVEDVEVTVAANTTGSTAGLVVHVNGDPSARFVPVTDVAWGSLGTEQTFQIPFEAESPGPIEAPPGELAVIAQLVAGVIDVTNPNGADLGSLAGTDAESRLKREQELGAIGGSTLEAIVGAVRALAGVDSVSGYENNTDAYDADGRPPHSIEIVVDGGDDDEIAQAIHDHKAAGTESFSYNANSGTAIDLNLLTTVVVPFSRAEQIEIVPTALVAYTGLVFDPLPVQQAIVDKGSERKIGQDVIYHQLVSAALTAPGVYDVIEFNLGLGGSGVIEENIPITPRQRPVFILGSTVVYGVAGDDD